MGTLDDFVCSGWWSLETLHKPYASPFTGRPLVQKHEDGSLSVAFYRYHVEDPLWFQRSVAMQVGKHITFGKPQPKIGVGDWSTTAFFYLDKPSTSLPAVPEKGSRTSGY